MGISNSYGAYEKIFERDSIYRSYAEHLINKTKELPEETKIIVKGILYDGGYDGFSVNSTITAPDNPKYEAYRRLNMAALAIIAPEDYKVIPENKVNLFHGTNSNALENILKYGVCSESEALKRGLAVLSGEFA